MDIDFTSEEFNFSAEACLFLKQYDLSVHPTVKIFRFFEYAGPTILEEQTYLDCAYLGAYSSLGFSSDILNSQVANYCTIGCYSQIGIPSHSKGYALQTDSLYQSSYFSQYTQSKLSFLKESKDLMGRPVKVAHDVFIGNRVLIPGQISIGVGAVIVDGSILTKNIPPFAIVEGVNKITGQRFSDELCADILESQWWKYDLPKIRRQYPKLDIKNIPTFLQFLKETVDLPKFSQDHHLLVSTKEGPKHFKGQMLKQTWDE